MAGLFFTGLGYVAIKQDVLKAAPWWKNHAAKVLITFIKLETYQLEALVFYASGDNDKVMSIMTVCTVVMEK